MLVFCAFRSCSAQHLGNDPIKQEGQYVHDLFTEEALGFIRENKDRPFFCYLPVTPPHGIFDIPEDDPAWALYKDKDSGPHDLEAITALAERFGGPPPDGEANHYVADLGVFRVKWERLGG